MSNLNLRLYAELFYGLYIPKLNNYLSDSIDKDSFISSFKSGTLKYRDISTKSQINLFPNLFLNFINIEVPDENNHLIIDIKDLKIILFLQEISDKDALELIINDKKNLREKFIENIFNKITNKSTNNNFLGGIIVESIANKILNGFDLNIQNLELIIKFQNFELMINIDKIEFIHKEISSKIAFKEIKISLTDITINEKVDFTNIENINISLDFNENNSNLSTNSKAEINNFKFIFNTKVIEALFEMNNIFINIEQKKFDLIVKKLIQFHRPKIKYKNSYKIIMAICNSISYKIKKIILFRKKNKFRYFKFCSIKIVKKRSK